MGEEWSIIPLAPDYEASSRGRVRRATPYRCTKVGKILKQDKCSDGHFITRLRHGGKVRGVGVHRLVCEAFHGPAPSEIHVAAHNNGVPHENTPGNVRWATPKENYDDRYLHGTDPTGERNPNAKLNTEEVLLIRSHLMFGERPATLSRMFGVSDVAITRIGQRKVWSHLEF